MSPTSLDQQPASPTNWHENLYVRLIGFGVVYYLSVSFGVKLVTQPEGISVIWPAIGMALAILLLIPQREWLPFLIVIFAINLFSNLASGVPLLASIGFSLVNALEPALGGWLMKRWLKESITFTRLKDVLGLAAVVVFVNGLTAFLWAFIPVLAFGAPYLITWLSWWILDSLSMLIITPFIITWVTGNTIFSKDFLKRKFETLIWLIILIGSTWLMFGAERHNIYVEQNPYMLFPILIWGAFRFSPRTSASALVITTVIALYSITSSTEFFPIGGDSPREKLISIQAFLCVASVTTMMLSTTFNERKQVFSDLEIQVAELQQAQAALLKSESHIKSISNNFTAGMIYQVLIKGDTRKFTYLSDSVRQLYGISPEEGMADASLIYGKVYEEDIALFTKTEDEAVRTLSTFKVEVRIKGPSDEIRWSSLVSTPRMLEDGSTCWDGIEFVITERKHAEQALRESEALYRQAIEVAGAVPYLQTYNIDGKGVRFDFIGEGIREIIGYEPDELTDKLFDSITLERRLLEDLAQYSWSEAIRRVRAGLNPIWKCEHRILARDEKIHWIFEAAVELRDPNGISRGSIGMFQDITERKQAELEREKLITELSEKNAELERFTYTVSHDLKSPIVTIRGFLGYLTEHARSGNIKRMESDIQRIAKATDKMQALLHDLLELSRVGRMMNTPETIEFDNLLHDALDIVHGQLEAHHVTVHTQPNLPTVHGDRQRLTEVLQNLLDNAIKYMGDQPNPRIEIGQQSEENGKPVFFVKDNGIGIAPEYRERIFGLFNKLDPKSDGTGIGLALVKRIVEVHSGRIWVESEIGKGSTFYFSLQAN